MAQRRRKPREDRLINLEVYCSDWAEKIDVAGVNTPSTISASFNVLHEAVSDARRDANSDYADDSLRIADSLQQSFAMLLDGAGFKVRLGGKKGGSKRREKNKQIVEVLEFARNERDGGASQARILVLARKRFPGRTKEANKKLFQRYKIFA